MPRRKARIRGLIGSQVPTEGWAAMLAFEEAGSSTNRPLIFVHGWCCHRGHMKELMSHFSAKHHVIAVDLPGHGETPLGNVSPSFDSFAASLCSFIVERELHRPILIGHSMGGRHQCGGGGTGSEVVGRRRKSRWGCAHYSFRARRLPRLVCAHQSPGFSTRRGSVYQTSFFLPFEHGAISEAIVTGMISHPEGLASALLKEFPALEAEPLLSAFRTPLLFIGGSYPRFDEAALKKVRPEAWVARVAVSGHFMQIFALPQIVTMIEKVHCRRGGTVARSYLATSCSFARYTYYHVCN